MNSSTTTMPTTASHELAAEIANRLAKWTPSGELVSCCDPKGKAEMIIGLGVCQNFAMLQTVWNQYYESDANCPDLLDAFSIAFMLCMRRCPLMVHPLLKQLLGRLTTFSSQTAWRLALIISELGSKEDAYVLLDKCRDIPDLCGAWYLSLLRLATETMSPPDMGLALEVVDRMEKAGKPHNMLTLKFVLCGLARLANPPIATAIRIIDYKRAMGLENCLVSTFFNVLDTAVGPDAQTAADYVKTLPHDVVHRPISSLCPEPPSINQAGCFFADCTTYIVVDVATVDLSGPINVPEFTYLVFLYSTVRTMETRANAVCSSNPVNRKVSDVKHLLATSKQAVVVPFETELRIRAGLPADTERPITTQDRFNMFVRITSQCKCVSFSVKVLSNDPIIMKAAKQHNVPVLSSLNGGPTPVNPSGPQIIAAAPGRA
jgi:hypothetical protein